MARRTARQRKNSSVETVPATPVTDKTVEKAPLTLSQMVMMRAMRSATVLFRGLAIVVMTSVVGFAVIPALAFATSLGSGVSINNNAQVFIAFWLVPFIFFCGMFTWFYVIVVKHALVKLRQWSDKVCNRFENKLRTSTKTRVKKSSTDGDVEK